MKTCSKCKIEKAESEFSKQASHKDGLASECKVCGRAATAAWQKANPEKVKAKDAAWRKANPEKVKANDAAWRKANPEKVKAKDAAWRKANPEKVKANYAAWVKANPPGERYSPFYISSNGARKLCSVDGCGRVHVSKGMCHMHYQRARIALKEFV